MNLTISIHDTKLDPIAQKPIDTNIGRSQDEPTISTSKLEQKIAALEKENALLKQENQIVKQQYRQLQQENEIIKKDLDIAKQVIRRAKDISPVMRLSLKRVLRLAHHTVVSSA